MNLGRRRALAHVGRAAPGLVRSFMPATANHNPSSPALLGDASGVAIGAGAWLPVAATPTRELESLHAPHLAAGMQCHALYNVP